MTIERIMSALVTGSEIGVTPPSGGDESGLIKSILFPVYFWAGTVAVIIIVVAGFMYTTSGGDPAKLTRAKNAILGAVIGLVVILSAFGITSVVLGVF